MSAILTHLIPVDELPEGQVSAIRNKVAENLIARASRELNMAPSNLLVRDLHWVGDLQAYSTGTTAATVNNWLFTTAASATTGFITVTGSKTMGDQRYCAIYGIKDNRGVYTNAAATVDLPTLGSNLCGMTIQLCQAVSLVKIIVGGTDKVIWDTCKLQCYINKAGISPSAVIIPQNTSYEIQYYKMENTNSVIAFLVLDGIIVEPRGKVIAP